MFKPISKIMFYFIAGVCLLLGWLGQVPVEEPFIFLAQSCTIFYFIYFFFGIFIINKIEQLLIIIKS